MDELRKYIPVDVYGKCGNMSTPGCGRNIFKASCSADVIQNYKFFFAAENTISKDYFTGR